MGLTVGIDLGTTNSAIAYIDEYDKAVVIANAQGERVTPSCVAFTEHGVIVGSEAKALKQAGAPHVAAFFKREMGNEHYMFCAHGNEYSAIDLSALVLQKLKENAETALGQPVSNAVITVPAYFREIERRNTLLAAEKAGLTVIKTINEPTAAALAYGTDMSLPNQRVLVYDLGGGTFDVTVLHLLENELQVLASEGDYRLGGKDWDERLVDYLLDAFKNQFGIDPCDDIEFIGELLFRAEDAKMRLTSAQNTQIALRHAGQSGRYDVTRDLFAELSADLLRRTQTLCEKVLAQTNLTPQHIDNILLVGGSTRMVMVHELIQTLFGKKPLVGVNVDEAVALGAAREAAQQNNQGPASTQASRAAFDRPSPASRIAPPLRKYPYSLAGTRTVRDVTNHSLGAIALSADGSKYINEILLHKNTAVPCSNAKQFILPVRAARTSVMDIYLTQGETTFPADMTYLGKYEVRKIPGNSSGKARIEVAYTYDTSGMVHIQAKDTLSGTDLPVTRTALAPNEQNRFLESPAQAVEVMHTHIMLTLDLSASMEGAPLAEAQDAAHRFVDELDFSHCRVGLMAVADKSSLICDLTSDAAEIRQAIDSLHIGMNGIGFGNDTHPFDHLLELLEPFTDERAVGVVLADGIWYRKDEAAQGAARCHAAGIPIVAIGFGTTNKAFLQSLASIDEAGILTEMNQLTETFSRIARVMSGKDEDSGDHVASQSNGMLGLLFKTVGAYKA